MCVTHDKCGSLLVNTRELVYMLKSNIEYWPLLSKVTIKYDNCNVKPTNSPTWISRF